MCHVWITRRLLEWNTAFYSIGDKDVVDDDDDIRQNTGAAAASIIYKDRTVKDKEVTLDI